MPKDEELLIGEKKIIRIEYGILVGLIGLGIYVGDLRSSLAGALMQLDRQGDYMLEVDKKLDAILKQTSRTEGMVEQMNKEN